MFPGGGYLVYIADGMCTPSRVSILPLFSNTGYRTRALFLNRLEKGNFARMGACFYVLEYTFRRFFLKLSTIGCSKF